MLSSFRIEIWEVLQKSRFIPVYRGFFRQYDQIDSVGLLVRKLQKTNPTHVTMGGVGLF